MNERILIVDDDEEDREFFRLAVNEISDQIICTEATDGEDALRLLTTAIQLPSYIFIDLNMPRINGLQLLKKIKSTTKFKDIPVIIYTTSKLQQAKAESFKSGAVYFITKPHKLSELEKEIAFVLDKKWTTVTID
jgi:CheY-like chemotaxis protein